MRKEKKVILYVDDDKPNLSVFKISYKREFKVIVASNGHDALEKLEQNDVQVLLTDQRMPGMTGIQLIEKIHALYPNMAIILVSEFAIADDIKEACEKFGVDKRITKPWNTEELKDLLHKLIEEKVA